MKFHLPVSVNEILWMLTFAGHLVLLVVLMGRDRVRRFPFFTASIVLITFRLLAARMLGGKLPQITMAGVFISLACLGAIITALMLYELAQKAFRGIKRNLWVGATIVMLLIGGIVLATWGEWPAWKTLTAGGVMPALQLLQLLALKATLLLDVETILLGLAIVIFGKRYQGGWRTHVQSISIGLAVASLAQLSMQAAWEIVARHAKPTSMVEYQHFMDFREHLFNANSGIYVAVLLWWITMLWLDEPKTSEPKTAAPVDPIPAVPELPATNSQPE